MNKHNLKVGQVLGDYRVVSVGEEGAYFAETMGEFNSVFWYTNDEIQTEFNLHKIKWVPKEGETYFFIDLHDNGEIHSSVYHKESASGEKLLKVGNMFLTKAEALSKAEEIKKVLMK